MGKKTDLVRLCDELENCACSRSCYKNEIVCTRKKLTEYINDDYNRLLKLKAQLRMNEGFNESTISWLTLIISVIALVTNYIYNTCGNFEGTYTLYVVVELGALGLLIYIFAVMAFYSGKNGARRKWEKYISVVLEAMEKEYA